MINKKLFGFGIMLLILISIITTYAQNGEGDEALQQNLIYCKL